MQTSTNQQPVPSSLRPIARKLCWWQSEDRALRDPIRFACQVMTFGTWNDVLTTRTELGDEIFKSALRNAPAGVFDARSWIYWHQFYKMTPVPPLPRRNLD